MLKNIVKLSVVFLIVCIDQVWAAPIQVDPSRYITVDEVRTDMDCYCLTVLEGTKVQKFPLKILSVVRNNTPGRDMILVIGLDEQFIHAGALHGCSGSPVFMDGRMAGALAAGWDGTLDPLYLVTPIHDMLRVGQAGGDDQAGNMGALDMSKPIDLIGIYHQYIDSLVQDHKQSLNTLALSTSLPAAACNELNTMFASTGVSLLPMAGGNGGGEADYGDSFEPGGVLVAGLCMGDINLSAAGTATEVVGDQVFGFGHAFFGDGATNLAMTNGKIHVVVASRTSSFKFSSPGKILGTLEFDQSTAVRGTIGTMPKLIDVDINIKRFDDSQERTYKNKMIVNKRLTPLLLQSVVNGAGMMRGALPPYHKVEYTIQFDIKGASPIVYKNISSDQMFRDIAMETTGFAAMLLNNPFKQAEIERIQVDMNVMPGTLNAGIWAADTAKTKLKAGETFSVDLTLQTVYSKQAKHTLKLDIPNDLPAGNYAVQICGLSQYEDFLQRMTPQRYNAFNYDSLLKGLYWITEFRQDRLYMVMAVPGSGIAMRERELPSLPGTKMLLMQDTKRMTPMTPVNHWVESSVPTEFIFSGKYVIEIEVVE